MDELRVRGKHCYTEPYTDGWLLKIFDAYPQENFDNLDKMKWGDDPVGDNPQRNNYLTEATIIQNYCWMHGIAPRVLDIVGVERNGKKYFAQIVEEVKGSYAGSKEEYLSAYKKVIAIGDVYGFKNAKEDVSRHDVMGGKLVDFNTFHFTKDHLDKILMLYTDLGRYGKKYYHDIPAYGLTGAPRKDPTRLEQMKLENVDFKGMSVLDLGCAGGNMCRYAKNRGARTVLGIDCRGKGSSDPVRAARVISNELGYFNIDFIEQDFGVERPAGRFDITFFLSINYHIGIPKWLSRITRRLCIFEDNSKGRIALPKLQRMFKRVEYIGKTFDHDKEIGKTIYFCYN